MGDCDLGDFYDDQPSDCTTGFDIRRLQLQGGIFIEPLIFTKGEGNASPTLLISAQTQKRVQLDINTPYARVGNQRLGGLMFDQ